jgi:hypothetical protein
MGRERRRKTLPKINPSLENEDSVVQTDRGEEDEEDDTFEQYLFGENDE